MCTWIEDFKSPLCTRAFEDLQNYFFLQEKEKKRMKQKREREIERKREKDRRVAETDQECRERVCGDVSHRLGRVAIVRDHGQHCT